MPRTLVYQVFVDRFAGAGGAALAPPPAASAPGFTPWTHHCGGTLDGIAARLDHIASLGADAIWLTPIFEAPSNHKYDGASFENVDPRFGGAEGFAKLAAAAKARGIGIVLDGVFNHVGETHPWFLAAKADARSDEAGFFRFRKHPDDYDRWRGYGHLPELELKNARLRRELWDGKDSVVRRWLRRGATGWRLDCANDVGLAACAAIARAAREEGAADGAIGEVMGWASEWVADGEGKGRLDGVMNYWFRESVIGALTGKIGVAQLAANLEAMARGWRGDALLRSWNALSTHDTPRLAPLVADPAARALARVLAFTLPGVPLVYYGEEIGMAAGGDPDNRGPMVWDESRWDATVLAQVKRLAQLRARRRALRDGGFTPLPRAPDSPLLAFLRATEGDPAERAVVVANLSAKEASATLFAPDSFLFDALPLADLLGTSSGAKMSAGSFSITLPPWGASILVPHDGTIAGYRFFKGRPAV